MVLAFWAVSRPTESDRIVAYLSSKHAKRERRKSSVSGISTAMANSLGQSLGARTESEQPNGAQNGHGDVKLETAAPDAPGNAGYGTTSGFNYEQLKD